MTRLLQQVKVDTPVARASAARLRRGLSRAVNAHLALVQSVWGKAVSNGLHTAQGDVLGASLTIDTGAGSPMRFTCSAARSRSAVFGALTGTLSPLLVLLASHRTRPVLNVARAASAGCAAARPRRANMPLIIILAAMADTNSAAPTGGRQRACGHVTGARSAMVLWQEARRQRARSARDERAAACTVSACTEMRMRGLGQTIRFFVCTALVCGARIMWIR